MSVTVHNPPPHPPALAIYILSFNGREILEQCLPSALDQGHVVVVDNGSTDGTLDFVLTTWKQTSVVRLSENVGLGHALNTAVETIGARNAILMNNDVIVVENALIRLSALLDEDPSIGLAAPKLLNADGSLQEFGNDIGLMGLPAVPRNVTLPVFETFFQSGCVTAVRRSQFLALGGYCRDFEWFYEDVDLAWKYRNAELRVVVDDRAACVHLLGATLGHTANPAATVGASDARARRRTYYSTRNVLLMYALRAPAYQLLVQLPFIIARQCAEALAAWAAGDLAMLRVYPKAWRDAATLIPRALRAHQVPRSHRRSTLMYVQVELFKMFRRLGELAIAVYRRRRSLG